METNGPTLKDRLTGNVITLERAREWAKERENKARTETLVKIFFSEQRQGLVDRTARIFEDICKDAGTRDVNQLLKDPKFVKETAMVIGVFL